MKIKKMTADFGKLHGETMEPGPGLNIIYAPNEGGKSTWCAFMRAMLYGVDSSQREKGGVKPDKVKFAPWSGTPMAGSMDVECELGNITLARETRSSGAPMRHFSAVYTGTDQPVSGLTAETAGEKLTGASRAVFERSVFILQSGMGVGNSPELEKRIAAIVSSGSEEASFTEVESRLRAWQRARRYNRSGMLPELEEQISQIREDLSEQASAAEELEQLRLRRERASKEREEAEVLRSEMRKTRRRRVLEQLNEKRAQLVEAEERARAAETEREITQRRLAESMFGAAGAEEVKKKTEEDAFEVRRLEAVSERRTPIWFWVIPLAACIACAVAAAVKNIPFMFIPAGIFFAVAAAVFAIYLSNRRKSSAAAAALQSLLGRYGVSGDEEILEYGREHEKLFIAAAEAGAEADSISAQLESMRREQTTFEERMLAELDFSHDASDPVIAADDRLHRLSEECAMVEGRLKASGDPLVLESELGVLEQTYAERKAEYDALALAIDTIRSADSVMQERFSPRLGARAAEIFAELTGGRYDSLTFNKALSARAKLSGDTLGHEADFLSQGTNDQLYLALRLAICELALPEENACPLVLDDALVNFDDERMERALDMLVRLAEKRQILLFTCHGREAEYLKNRENVTVIA